MRKSKIVFSGVLLLGLLSLTGCFGKKAATPTTNQEPSNTNQAVNVQNGDQVDGEKKVSGSVENLLSLGANVKCTWGDSEGEDRIVGDIYISGNKYYQEVTFPDNGKFFSVSDGQYVYMWNTRVPGGTKFLIEKKEDENVGEGVKETVKENDFTCVAWNVDATKFKLPTDVAFADQTEMLKQAETQAANGPKNGCEACNNVLDERLKSECRKGLKCDE